MSANEFERIRALAETFGAPGDHVAIGIGDDAAVLRLESHQAVSVDVAVEGVHFRRSFADWRTLGRRAYAAAASDLAAVAAKPRAALVSLILPTCFADEDLQEVGRGIADLGEEIGAPVIGGNLSRGEELSITTTVLGVIPDKPLTREGSRPGDQIWVTGNLGAAALGLRHLSTGIPSENADPFVDAWRRPSPRIAEGLSLSTTATSCIDVSDGLIQDLTHVTDASRVAATVQADALPLAAGHQTLASDLGVDGTLAALSGGEDYELLFTLPPTVDPAFPATRIGEIHAGKGISILDAANQPLAVDRAGFAHFG